MQTTVSSYNAFAPSAPAQAAAPTLRDYLRCVFSFLTKVRTLASKRGDHGSALEHKVIERFADGVRTQCHGIAADVELAAEADLAADHELTVVLADGVIEPHEVVAVKRALTHIRASQRMDRDAAGMLRV